MLNITLEQLKALVAFADHGSFVAAAKALKKNHSAIVYALQNLEAQTDLMLLDRSSYRTRLTDAGVSAVAAARKVLHSENEFAALCHILRSGWEPALRIVVDGVYPSAAILAQVRKLLALKVPTSIEVMEEFLGRVEASFIENEAHVMISVLPPVRTDLEAIALPKLRMVLVAHKKHALAKKTKLSMNDLSEHVLLTVRGSDPRLRLPTTKLEGHAPVRLNDFYSKKEAILDGIGYGWLPENLAVDEIKKGTLKKLALGNSSTHELTPHAYVKRGAPRGRALDLVIANLENQLRAV